MFSYKRNYAIRLDKFLKNNDQFCMRACWNNIMEELRESQKHVSSPIDNDIITVLENQSQVKWRKDA